MPDSKKRSRKSTESVCYTRNFLEQVIFRLDFALPVAKVNESLPSRIRKTVRKLFPIIEPTTPLTPQFTLMFDLKSSSPKASAIQSGSVPTLRNWKFHNTTNTQTLDISPTAVVLDISEFSNYVSTRDTFMKVVDILFVEFPALAGSRLGLRYVNNIRLHEPDPFDWSKYLNSRLLSRISEKPNGGDIIRDVHSLEVRFPECGVRFQTGIQNADYPAPIRRKEFLLDIDAYKAEPLEGPEVKKALDQLHKRIQHYFEISITDELRKLLNE